MGTKAHLPSAFIQERTHEKTITSAVVLLVLPQGLQPPILSPPAMPPTQPLIIANSELFIPIRGSSNRSALNSFLRFCVHGAWLLFRQNYAAHCVSLEGLLSLFQTDKSFESMIMRWFIPMAISTIL